MRQSGCTRPMTSPSTSCPKLLNRKFTIGGKKKKGQEQLPDSFLRILNESVPSCSHPSCLLWGLSFLSFSCPLFSRLLSAWGAAATPVIPFRQGTHGEGADPQMCKQTLTSSYTKMHHRAHTHTHIHLRMYRRAGRGEGVDCWLKRDKDNKQDSEERRKFERKTRGGGGAQPRVPRWTWLPQACVLWKCVHVCVCVYIPD